MSEWESIVFDDIAYLIKGISYTSEEYGTKGNGDTFITLKCIAKDGGFKSEGIKYFQGSIPENLKLSKGDLLFANTDLTRDGDIVGCPLFLPLDGEKETITMSMDLSKVVLKNDKTDLNFLYYLLMTPKVRKFMKDNSSGSTVLHLKTSEIPKLKLYIPKSKTEQSKIAEILSTIDKAIEQTEATIAKQQRIKNGLMQDLLTKGIDKNGNLRSEETHGFKDSELGRVPKEWEIKSLSSLTSLISSGVTPRGGYKIYKKEGIPFIRSQNVYPFGIITEDIVFISDEIHESMSRTKVQNFDVLLNITGASIGRCCQVPKGFSESNVNQHVCIIRLNNNSEEYSKFIATFLASDFGQRQIFNQMAGGNREGLNFDEIGSFHVPEIDDKEAQRITNSIEKIEKTITAFEQENNKLKRQKTGLMQDLLTGKISVEKLINTTN
nr:restriction endonuclease subunit S [uncultured Draconibacterium sp.]